MDSLDKVLQQCEVRVAWIQMVAVLTLTIHRNSLHRMRSLRILRRFSPLKGRCKTFKTRRSKLLSTHFQLLSLNRLLVGSTDRVYNGRSRL
jgi:hypothetical protein